MQTQAQHEQIQLLMDQTGVNSVWICNEVANPGASTGRAGEFTAWGGDVNMPAFGESGFYEPARELKVVRGTCPPPIEGHPERPFVDGTVPISGPDCPTIALDVLCGPALTTKTNYYRGGICQQNQKNCTNCCSHQNKSDGVECSQGCDTGTQLTYEQRECYCSTCPPGKRVRYNPTEQDYINSEYNKYEYVCPSGAVSQTLPRPNPEGCTRQITARGTIRNAVATRQTYEGPMCGFVRRRFDAVSNEWTVDWGEKVCDDSMPFVCEISGQSRGDAYRYVFDHCRPYNRVLGPLARTEDPPKREPTEDPAKIAAPVPSGGKDEATVTLLGVVAAAVATASLA